MGRTDAVAMNVLDPFEVADIEIWPLWELQNKNSGDAGAKAINEGDFRPARPVKLPKSIRGCIIPEALYRQRKHPDVRIARRATTIAALARVIGEREVSKGLRRTLKTQAERLQGLAAQRYGEVSGAVPTVEPGEEV